MLGRLTLPCRRATSSSDTEARASHTARNCLLPSALVRASSMSSLMATSHCRASTFTAFIESAPRCCAPAISAVNTRRRLSPTQRPSCTSLSIALTSHAVSGAFHFRHTTLSAFTSRCDHIESLAAFEELTAASLTTGLGSSFGKGREWPDHVLQRIRPSRSGSNRTRARVGSLRLDR